MRPRCKVSPHYHKDSVNICNVCNGPFQNIKIHMTDQHCNSYFYRCSICPDYRGSRKSSLFQHLKDKHNATYCYIVCPICMGFISPNEDDIANHLWNAHSRTEQMFFCNHCPVQSKFNLDSHFENVHSHYVCVFNQCQSVCINSVDLFKHYIDYHFPKLTLYYECPECDFMFPKENSLYQHKRDKHGIVDEEEAETSIQLYCNLCDFKTYDKHDYQEHIDDDHPDDFYNCSFQNCNYETNRFWSLIQHTVDKHLSYSFLRYYCYICEEISYTKINSLIQHLRDKHTILHSCTLCDTYEDDLSDHILSDPDHAERYFSCKLCNEEYDEKYELVDHISDDHVYIIPLLRSLCYGT